MKKKSQKKEKSISLFQYYKLFKEKKTEENVCKLFILPLSCESFQRERKNPNFGRRQHCFTNFIKTNSFRKHR